MGLFSKITDDTVNKAADTAKDVAEDKIDDVVGATGMEDNAMVEGVADKATEMSGDGVDAVADKIIRGEEATCCGGDKDSEGTCTDGTCSS